MSQIAGAERLGSTLERQAMQVADLCEVLHIEQQAYPFPWSRRNFEDSLASGYLARVWRDTSGRLQAYYLAMEGVDEFHLLNITVDPASQGRGWARLMLADLRQHAAAQGRQQIWLEVRESNAQARAVYLHLGFVEVGRRRAYYPAAGGLREDAILMSLHWATGSATEARS